MINSISCSSELPVKALAIALSSAKDSVAA
jgi:hypothetical protein